MAASSEPRARLVRNVASRGTFGGPAAGVAGWLLIALVNAVMFEILRPHGGFKLRATAHLYDFGNDVVAGLLTALAILGFRRVEAWLKPQRPRAIQITAIACASIIVGGLSLPDELSNFAFLNAARFKLPLRAVLAAVTLAVSWGIPIGVVVAGWLASHRMRAIPLALGLVLAVVNNRVLLHDYEIAHFFLAWLAASVVAAALATAPVPAFFDRVPRRVRVAGLGAAAVLGAVSVLVRPSPAVALALLNLAGSVFTPVVTIAGFDQAAGADRAVIPPAQAAWFAPREGLPPIPSTTPATITDRAIVVFITIDALRAEVVLSHRHDDVVPVLARMRDTGVDFTGARTPGAQTVYTLSSLFTGKYFSQLDWSGMHEGLRWAIADRTPRWPFEATKAQIPNIYFAPISWISQTHGLTGGFGHEQVLPHAPGQQQYAHASVAATTLINRLSEAGSGSLFLYTHMMDAHAPYDLGGTRGTAYERYLREVTLVDTAVGRVLEAIRQLGLAERTFVFVSADHGEAFGEHDSYFHGVSVYEELVHVPLLVQGPGFVPRHIDVPVSLLDVPPTILDLLGLPTPARIMGESLLPVLRGEAPHFTRPVLSEDRLKQAMYFDDGVKAIRDLRRGAHEVYDLRKDPGELENLIEDPNLDDDARFALIGAFFKAHALQRLGYRTPLRK